MIGYASRTGTRRNLDVLRRAGWGLLISPPGDLRDEGFDRIAVDNGAYSAWQRGVAWDSDPFLRAVDLFGDRADWVAAPDIVMGGRMSLERSRAWLPRLLDVTERVLIPVQDGMEPDDVRELLGGRVGVFVGGSAPWKEESMGRWGEVCRARGAWCHVGRVNTSRRIRLCHLAKADSFDGTSVSRFACNIGKLNNARRAPTFPWEPM